MAGPEIGPGTPETLVSSTTERPWAISTVHIAFIYICTFVSSKYIRYSASFNYLSFKNQCATSRI